MFYRPECVTSVFSQDCTTRLTKKPHGITLAKITHAVYLHHGYATDWCAILNPQNVTGMQIFCDSSLRKKKIPLL